MNGWRREINYKVEAKKKKRSAKNSDDANF